MQAAPGGSSKTVADPDARPKGSQTNDVTSSAADSKGQSLKSSEHDPSAIFRNGVLAVPGVDADVQTAPAKFSKRSDAADKLPLAAYALRHLTSEQRTSIHRTLYKTLALTGEAPLTSAVVGAEIPTHVSLAGLEPLPDRITSVMPELEGLSFVRAGDKILLASPTMHRVLAVLE
jgi:hypothetical protein